MIKSHLLYQLSYVPIREKLYNTKALEWSSVLIPWCESRKSPRKGPENNKKSLPETETTIQKSSHGQLIWKVKEWYAL